MLDSIERQHATEPASGLRPETWQVGRVALEVFVSGAETAPRVLFLHDVEYLNGLDYDFLARLAERWRIIAPSHPGFGHSSLPDDFDSVGDLAYVYLDLLEQIGPAHLIGCGFGGWIAAEIAVRCSHHLQAVVLVDALGIKVGDVTTADIADIFAAGPADLVALLWHDQQRGQQVMPLPLAERGWSEDELTLLFSNRRAAALFGWKPYLHNPKLKARLARIRRPTLVVWGAADRLVRPAYGQAFASGIPHARFQQIADAGHYPYLEQSTAFSNLINDFLGSSR